MKIKLNKIISTVLICSQFVAATALADVEIGKGYTCNGTSIIKGTKTVAYSKAKSNLATTLTNLRTKLSKASTKKKKDQIKAQIAEVNNARTLLKACSQGQLSDTEVDPIFNQLASGTGTYDGTYSGTVSGLLPISGEITAQFVLEGTSFSTLLTLGGNLASALKAKPLSFTGDVGGIGFPAQFNLPDTFLGSVTLSVTKDGHLTITNSGSSKGTVTFDGQFSNQKITSTLNGQYDGVPFEGGATLTRKP